MGNINQSFYVYVLYDLGILLRTTSFIYRSEERYFIYSNYLYCGFYNSKEGGRGTS